MMEEQKDFQGKQLPVVKCPVCSHEMDCATCVEKGREKERPRPGDFTLCICCGEILCFGEGLLPRVPLLSEMMALSDDTHRVLDRAQFLIRKERPIS